MVRIPAVIIAALVASGCASNPNTPTPTAYFDDTSRSIPLRVALTTGLTDPVDGPLFDIPRDELPLSDRDMPDHYQGDIIRDALNVATVASALGSNPILWSARSKHFLRSDFGKMFVLDLLLYQPTNPHPATRPQVIAWMPRSMADNPRDARLKMSEILREAAVAALNEEITAETRIVEHTAKLTRITSRREKVFLTGIEGCNSTDLLCELWVFAYDPLNAVSPDGTDSWHWRNWQPGDVRNQLNGTIGSPGIYSQLRPVPPVLADRDYLFRFAMRLPEWAWTYLPPTESEPPMMVNGGGIYFFVEPIS